MTLIQELLRDPVEPLPARPSRFDVGVAVLAAISVTLETIVVDAWPARAAEVLLAAVLTLVLPFRRTHPFGAFKVAFGVIIASQWIQYTFTAPGAGLGSGAFVLLLPHTLGRYARGREVVVGLGLMVATFVGSLLTGEFASWGDAVGALVVLHFPLAVGLGLRALDGRHLRDVAHAQLLERQLLARELHDTVAHRVTAITLQAQAAKAVLQRKPEATREALDAIESEAALALAELRSLLGTLRGDDVPLRPGGGLDGLDALLRGSGPHVHLTKEGPQVPLTPAMEHALHRIVRESLHNAEKHGRGVTRVDVRLDTTGAAVLLTVTDNGQPVRAPATGGFGLVGMRERATLVGGRLEAGPIPGGGWRVHAELPREQPRDGRRP